MAFTRIIITARNTLSGTRLSRDLEDLTRIFRRFQKAYLVLFSYMGQKYFGKCPGKQKKVIELILARIRARSVERD